MTRFSKATGPAVALAALTMLVDTDLKLFAGATQDVVLPPGYQLKFDVKSKENPQVVMKLVEPPAQEGVLASAGIVTLPLNSGENGSVSETSIRQSYTKKIQDARTKKRPFYAKYLAMEMEMLISKGSVVSEDFTLAQISIGVSIPQDCMFRIVEGGKFQHVQKRSLSEGSSPSPGSTHYGKDVIGISEDGQDIDVVPGWESKPRKNYVVRFREIVDEFILMENPKLLHEGNLETFSEGIVSLNKRMASESCSVRFVTSIRRVPILDKFTSSGHRLFRDRQQYLDIDTKMVVDSSGKIMVQDSSESGYFKWEVDVLDARDSYMGIPGRVRGESRDIYYTMQVTVGQQTPQLFFKRFSDFKGLVKSLQSLDPDDEWITEDVLDGLPHQDTTLSKRDSVKRERISKFNKLVGALTAFAMKLIMKRRNLNEQKALNKVLKFLGLQNEFWCSTGPVALWRQKAIADAAKQQTMLMTENQFRKYRTIREEFLTESMRSKNVLKEIKTLAKNHVAIDGNVEPEDDGLEMKDDGLEMKDVGNGGAVGPMEQAAPVADESGSAIQMLLTDSKWASAEDVVHSAVHWDCAWYIYANASEIRKMRVLTLTERLNELGNNLKSAMTKRRASNACEAKFLEGVLQELRHLMKTKDKEPTF